MRTALVVGLSLAIANTASAGSFYYNPPSNGSYGPRIIYYRPYPYYNLGGVAFLGASGGSFTIPPPQVFNGIPNATSLNPLQPLQAGNMLVPGLPLNQMPAQLPGQLQLPLPGGLMMPGFQPQPQLPNLPVVPANAGGGNQFGIGVGIPAGAPPRQAPEAAAIDQFLTMLGNPREQDRIDAAIALGRNRIAKAAEPLAKVLASDESAKVRDAAARALGLIGSFDSLNALQTAALGDADREVRLNARFAAQVIKASNPGRN